MAYKLSYITNNESRKQYLDTVLTMISCSYGFLLAKVEIHISEYNFAQTCMEYFSASTENEDELVHVI